MATKTVLHILGSGVAAAAVVLGTRGAPQTGWDWFAFAAAVATAVAGNQVGLHSDPPGSTPSS